MVVAGSGRSGTSSIAGVLKLAGLRIPPPEVEGNKTNPRGFFEPRWVVDFQTRLLRDAGVVLTDARPDAFDLTRKVGERPKVRETAGTWLREQTAGHDALVLKDPRNSWFLPLWSQACADAGAGIGYLTMLRHPAEVVGSKDAYYKARSVGGSVRHAQTTRVASWLNVALFSEQLTRGGARTFVPYVDLLDDWRTVVARVVDELALPVGGDLSPAATAEIDEFVDPGLHRIRTEWSDIDCPDDVRDLAQATWDQLDVLARSGGSDAAAEAALDELRAQYVTRYADAEALAQSTAEAARRAAAHQAKKKAGNSGAGGPGARPASKASPPPAERATSFARRVARRARRSLRG